MATNTSTNTAHSLPDAISLAGLPIHQVAEWLGLSSEESRYLLSKNIGGGLGSDAGLTITYNQQTGAASKGTLVGVSDRPLPVSADVCTRVLAILQHPNPHPLKDRVPTIAHATDAAVQAVAGSEMADISAPGESASSPLRADAGNVTTVRPMASLTGVAGGANLTEAGNTSDSNARLSELRRAHGLLLESAKGVAGAKGLLTYTGRTSEDVQNARGLYEGASRLAIEAEGILGITPPGEPLVTSDTGDEASELLSNVENLETRLIAASRQFETESIEIRNVLAGQELDKIAAESRSAGPLPESEAVDATDLPTKIGRLQGLCARIREHHASNDYGPAESLYSEARILALEIVRDAGLPEDDFELPGPQDLDIGLPVMDRIIAAASQTSGAPDSAEDDLRRETYVLTFGTMGGLRQFLSLVPALQAAVAGNGRGLAVRAIFDFTFDSAGRCYGGSLTGSVRGWSGRRDLHVDLMTLDPADLQRVYDAVRAVAVPIEEPPADDLEDQQAPQPVAELTYAAATAQVQRYLTEAERLHGTDETQSLLALRTAHFYARNALTLAGVPDIERDTFFFIGAAESFDADLQLIRDMMTRAEAQMNRPVLTVPPPPGGPTGQPPPGNNNPPPPPGNPPSPNQNAPRPLRQHVIRVGPMTAEEFTLLTGFQTGADFDDIKAGIVIVVQHMSDDTLHGAIESRNGRVALLDNGQCEGIMGGLRQIPELAVRVGDVALREELDMGGGGVAYRNRARAADGVSAPYRVTNRLLGQIDGRRGGATTKGLAAVGAATYISTEVTGAIGGIVQSSGAAEGILGTAAEGFGPAVGPALRTLRELKALRERRFINGRFDEAATRNGATPEEAAHIRDTRIPALCATSDHDLHLSPNELALLPLLAQAANLNPSNVRQGGFSWRFLGRAFTDPGNFFGHIRDFFKGSEHQCTEECFLRMAQLIDDVVAVYDILIRAQNAPTPDEAQALTAHATELIRRMGLTEAQFTALQAQLERTFPGLFGQDAHTAQLRQQHAEAVQRSGTASQNRVTAQNRLTTVRSAVAVCRREVGAGTTDLQNVSKPLAHTTEIEGIIMHIRAARGALSGIGVNNFAQDVPEAHKFLSNPAKLQIFLDELTRLADEAERDAQDAFNTADAEATRTQGVEGASNVRLQNASLSAPYDARDELRDRLLHMAAFVGKGLANEKSKKHNFRTAILAAAGFGITTATIGFSWPALAAITAYYGVPFVWRWWNRRGEQGLDARGQVRASHDINHHGDPVHRHGRVEQEHIQLAELNVSQVTRRYNRVLAQYNGTPAANTQERDRLFALLMEHEAEVSAAERELLGLRQAHAHQQHQTGMQRAGAIAADVGMEAGSATAGAVVVGTTAYLIIGFALGAPILAGPLGIYLGYKGGQLGKRIYQRIRGRAQPAAAPAPH